MLTGRCNYNCRHCFNAADNAPLQSEWSPAEALRLLDEAEACGILCFTLTGGEPMLHPHFAKICRGIYARNMYVGEINTNGYFITEDTLRSIRDAGEPLPLMKISFDGLGHHDWMRSHAGAQERTLNAIRLCLDHGFRVMVQMNVHRGNVAYTLPTLRHLDRMGVHQTRVIRTSESPRWLENAPEMTLTPEEYFDRMLEVMGACRWFRYCCGGCRALGLSTSGDEYHPDLTKCLFFEKGYYGKIAGVMSGWKNLSAVSGAVGDGPNGA